MLDFFYLIAVVTHIYEYSNQWQNFRTIENYEESLKNSTTQNPVNGIKGKSLLSSLKYFYPVKSTCIDYIHGVLEGVVKHFFKFWFYSEANAPYSMKKYMQEIDQRIVNIQPPKFVTQTPRSIYTHNLWKAHEYLSFILYFALPVFRDIMSFDRYQHPKIFIILIEALLAPEINVDYLKKVEFILIEFVRGLATFYPKNIMLSGVHELLHLTQCTLDFGPLKNRKLLRFIHGFDLVGEELIKIFTTAQVLSTFAVHVKNKELKEFITS
jgi:hypothetical protein